MDFYGTSPRHFDAPYDFSTLIDVREEIHKVLFGALDFPAQGEYVILREFTEQTCPACWDKDQGGSKNVNCTYCDGEGYQFRERIVTMALFAGVAPVYKPSIIGTGQYPISDYGYTDPNRYTGYVEYTVFPNYERYTIPQTQTPDKMYQLKVDERSRLVIGHDGQPVRTAKWKMLAVTPVRGDKGQVSFFEIGLIKENIS
jgi:hypothetical protein